MTPNHLTTLSLIFGLLCIYSFHHQYFIISAILYFISYCYDVLDGNYARKYQMVTKFGDLYDHVKDISVNLLLLYIFYKHMTYKNNTPLLVVTICITVILLITLNINLGCQEVYVSKKDKKNKSAFLSFTARLCHKNIYNNLHIFRYFGCGTFIMWICIALVVWYQMNRNLF